MTFERVKFCACSGPPSKPKPLCFQPQYGADRVEAGIVLPRTMPGAVAGNAVHT
ncbi:MAG: hypothetical protein JWO67_540 [Streptosporangiaceae bacterium]|nr:hypothetical protein [Streptosporangiaceae bacterium]